MSKGSCCSFSSPSGTYLAFASAGDEDTELGKAYEEVALAVTLRPDQNNGRMQIRLQKQASKIEFHSPDDMIERLRRLSKGSPDSRCGHLRSIGRSTRVSCLILSCRDI